MPRRSFRKTLAARHTVREAAKDCLPQKLIAAYIFNPETGKGIAETTLRKHFREELAYGQAATMGLAMKTLREILADASKFDSDRIRAADIILRRFDGGLLADVSNFGEEEEDDDEVRRSIFRKLRLEFADAEQKKVLQPPNDERETVT